MKFMNDKVKICYFGAYNAELARNEVYLKGLRLNGAETIECADSSWGPIKYFKLFVKHWKIRKMYDVMIVGYAGHFLVPFARLICHKPIIFNAMTSLYEANIVSRKKYSPYSPLAWRIWLIDWMAFKLSDLVLVETNEQKKYLVKKFRIASKKFERLFIGANDSIFYPDENIKKNNVFTVLFRGRLLPEAGVEHILETAEILKNEDIQFLILGFGLLEGKIRKKIGELNLKNLELISERLNIEELRRRMLSAHVGIGQIENHERLERTIPYKAFEYLAIKLPYINGNGRGIRELLQDRENCLLVNLADSEDLAQKIMELKNNLELGKKIAENGYKLYQEKLTPQILGKELLDLCLKFVKK